MPDTVPHYITFGLGTPYGRTYTEVRVPAHLSRAEQSDLARATAFDRYGRSWAFHYEPRHYHEAIARYRLTLRETIDATTPPTQED